MKIKTMFTVIMILTMFSGVKAETVENLERMRAKALTVIDTSSKPCCSAASLKSTPSGINIGIKI